MLRKYLGRLVVFAVQIYNIRQQQLDVLAKKHIIIPIEFYRKALNFTRLKPSRCCYQAKFRAFLLERNIMKAIETVYNGYRFRSRLEARWAVFFDAMGFEYEYELEGYDLGDDGYYLPDFWLPRVKMWAEVKATDFDKTELSKAQSLVAFTGYDLLMLVGIPSKIPYTAIMFTSSFNLEHELESRFVEIEYELSNTCDYYKTENRFFNFPNPDSMGDDMDIGIIAARQARFEHGETPIVRQI